MFHDEIISRLACKSLSIAGKRVRQDVSWESQTSVLFHVKCFLCQRSVQVCGEIIHT